MPKKKKIWEECVLTEYHWATPCTAQSMDSFITKISKILIKTILISQPKISSTPFFIQCFLIENVQHQRHLFLIFVLSTSKLRIILVLTAQYWTQCYQCLISATRWLNKNNQGPRRLWRLLKLTVTVIVSVL